MIFNFLLNNNHNHKNNNNNNTSNKQRIGNVGKIEVLDGKEFYMECIECSNECKDMGNDDYWQGLLNIRQILKIGKKERSTKTIRKTNKMKFVKKK